MLEKESETRALGLFSKIPNERDILVSDVCCYTYLPRFSMSVCLCMPNFKGIRKAINFILTEKTTTNLTRITHRHNSLLSSNTR